MKISVVTPSFNQGKYIKDCINSVRNQTYRPIEHIIVDNCSIDGTKEILEEYKKNSNDVEVKIIIEPDKSQSDALNKGFKKAAGDLVAWLNADDNFLPDAFQKVTQFFFDNPSADIIYGNYYFVDEDGGILKKRKEIGFDPNVLFYVGCYIPSSGTLFKRQLFKEGFFLDVSFDITMDYEFFVRLSNAKKKFMHIPEFISCFRWHQKNKSLDFVKRRQERYRVQQMYGKKIFRNPDLNQKFYNIMFYPYLAKRVIKKLLSGCYF